MVEWKRKRSRNTLGMLLWAAVLKINLRVKELLISSGLENTLVFSTVFSDQDVKNNHLSTSGG